MSNDTGELTGVSIVVPHYGDIGPTQRLVEALRAQRGAPPLQLIVVDDASPTAFPEAPGMELIRRAENGGFGSAVNTGSRHAVHSALLVLNSDLEIERDFVARLVDAARPWWPAVVGPLMTDRSGRHTYSGRRFPTATQHFVEWLTPLARWRSFTALHWAVGHDTRCRADDTHAVDWLVGAALLLPTAVFREAGGFDERYYMNSEEVDLQRRLRSKGIPSVHAGTVRVVHEGGGSSDPRLRRRWVVGSRLRYGKKWGGFVRLRAALTIATAVNLVWDGLRRAAGRPVRPVHAATADLRIIWQRVD